ncbi:MAG: NAD(P)H-dependent glycerol-3-phosphate dehydrogenase [Pseudanabaenaceae cyanobacterium]
MNVMVLGQGIWGQTLARLVQRNGHRAIALSCREPLPPQPADLLISAVAVAGVPTAIERLRDWPAIPLITATKGLDARTEQTPSQLWQGAFPDRPLAVLSGPNLATEINQGLPAAAVVASHHRPLAEQVQTLLASRQFRVYTNDDPLGVELGGTLKNAIALAVGVCDGLSLGSNARAALVTRGMAEMVRIAVEFGARPETLWGLAGLGDLLATCTSPLSRNYQVGQRLAQGLSLSEALATVAGTAEGVNTVAVLQRWGQHRGISLPICTCTHRLLQGEIQPQQAVAELMDRELKPESLPR